VVRKIGAEMEMVAEKVRFVRIHPEVRHMNNESLSSFRTY